MKKDNLFLPALVSPPPEPPVSELPVNRMMERSADYLSDTELLSVIIGSRLSATAALEASRTLLTRSGGLDRIGSMSASELMKILGLGQASACAVRAAFALARRRLAFGSLPRPVIESPADVAGYARHLFVDRHQEEFHVLLLNTRNHLLRDHTVTVGLLDRSPIHAREVFREAICESCSRVILAHNHPTGDPSPSPQDIKATRGLVEAGVIIGIEVLDHVIIGSPVQGREKYWLSMKEAGLMRAGD